MVYFIQSTLDPKPIKIGFTKSISSRFKNLQREFKDPLIILGTIPGGFKTEREIHEKFNSFRIYGEWFLPDQSILNFIEQNKSVPIEDHTNKFDHLLPSVKRILTELGENIRLARLRRRISTAMLAERAGISRPTLRYAEKGDPGVSIGIYANILHSLGLEKDLLLVGKDDELGRKLQDIELGQRVRHRKS